MTERIDDLIALAAFGELTSDERAELDAAAAADPVVAAELAAELETAAELLASTPMVAPPTLRASVLDAIATTPQDDAVSSAEGEPTAPVASMAQARERRKRRLGPMLSAAAAVALVAVGSVVLFNSGDDTDQFAAVAEATDARQRTFGGDLAGMLRVVHSPGENAIIVDGTDLPSIDAQRSYVLWFITGDEAIPVAEFRPDDSGAVQERFDDLDPGDAVLGITEEPVGGSATPTLPILATA